MWRTELLRLANRYYDEGHTSERRAVEAGEDRVSLEWWTRAECCRQFYGDLCSLVGRVDPKPGAPEAPARPW
jgi:hypothetical protein